MSGDAIAGTVIGVIFGAFFLLIAVGVVLAIRDGNRTEAARLARIAEIDADPALHRLDHDGRRTWRLEPGALDTARARIARTEKGHRIEFRAGRQIGSVEATRTGWNVFTDTCWDRGDEGSSMVNVRRTGLTYDDAVETVMRELSYAVAEETVLDAQLDAVWEQRKA